MMRNMRAARLLSLLTCTWVVLSLSAEASELVCPIMFNGHAGGYRARTQLTIVNPGTEPLSAAVKAFKNDGTPAAVFRGNPNAVSQTSLELTQNEVMIKETDGESSVIQDGWLLLSYQTGARPVVTADIYLLKEGETCSPESVFRVPFVEAGTRLISVAQLTLDWSTGTYQVLSASAFALVNPSDTKPRGTVSVVSDSPLACGGVDLDLPAARYSQGVVSAIGAEP